MRLIDIFKVDKTIHNLDPNANTNYTVKTFPIYEGSTIIVQNYSGARFIITFPNGFQSFIAPFEKRAYAASASMGLPSGNITFTTQTYFANPFADTEYIIVEVYDPSEPFIEIYPQSIPPWAFATGDLFSSDNTNTSWGSARVNAKTVINSTGSNLSGFIIAKYLWGFDCSRKEIVSGTNGPRTVLTLTDLTGTGNVLSWDTIDIAGTDQHPWEIRFPFPLACCGIANGAPFVPTNLTFSYTIAPIGGSSPERSVTFYTTN